MGIMDRLKDKMFGLDKLNIPKYKPTKFMAPDNAAERDSIRALVAPAQHSLRSANIKPKKTT